MPAALGIVEITLPVGLQSHCKFMKVISYLVIVVECLIKVSFVVAIQIMETNKLVAAYYVYLFVNNFNPQRLKQADEGLPDHSNGQLGSPFSLKGCGTLLQWIGP